MKATIATHSAELTDLAGLLARAYLRLAKHRENLGTFRAEEPQKDLDLCAATRPPCDPADRQERPQWKRTSSVKSAAFSGSP